MAKMKHEDVIKELIALGVDYDVEATYSELVTLLKEKREETEGQQEPSKTEDEEQIVQTTPEEEPIVGESGGRAFKENTLLDGVYFAKGEGITPEHMLYQRAVELDLLR